MVWASHFPFDQDLDRLHYNSPNLTLMNDSSLCLGAWTAADFFWDPDQIATFPVSILMMTSFWIHNLENGRDANKPG